MKVTFVTCVLVAAGLTAHAEVREEHFQSASLGRDVAYAVQLPPSYAKGADRYPVLYVLHGLFENHTFWQERGLAPLAEAEWAAGRAPEMVVVAADGGNSFFVNGPGGRYEDLVTKDLIAEVEGRYRVRTGRDGRVLLGVSMGGYAALRIALTRPELFRAVATHSAMLLEQIPTAAGGASSWHMNAFHKVFGDPIDPALWAASDPLDAARKATPAGLPALSFDCGTEDRFGLFAGNRALDRILTERGIPHAFGLFPGNHGYEYVKTRLAASLAFLGDALEKK